MKNILKAKKNNGGTVLAGSLLLMLILVVMGHAMVRMAGNETRREVRSRARESAFYVADAGIEKAIHRIKGGDNFTFSFNADVGLNTGSKAGEAGVNVLRAGGIYTITSQGHTLLAGGDTYQRTIRAVVETEAGLPEFASQTGGQSKFAGNIDVHGVIFSNEPIEIGTGVTFRPDEEGNVAIYTSNPGDSSITIGNNFDFDPDNEATGLREILARGGIQNSHRIPGDVHWQEYDNSTKTDHKGDVLFVDADALIGDPETLVNYDFGGKFDVTDGRITFDGTGTTVLELEERVYYYPNGAVFNSNLEIKGKGTIVVGGPDSGNYDNGIVINQNVSGHDDDARINLIDATGNWNDIDIVLKNNVDLKTIIQTPGDVEISQNFDFEGILAAGGDLDIKQNVSFTYSDDLFDVPLKEGPGGGGVRVVSWTEIQ